MAGEKKAQEGEEQKRKDFRALPVTFDSLENNDGRQQPGPEGIGTVEASRFEDQTDDRLTISVLKATIPNEPRLLKIR